MIKNFKIMQTKYLKMSMYALLISALTFACGDDEEDEKEPEVITAVIELSSPADAATFDMQTVEAITFEWKKDANLSDYQLLVSATQDLANPVVSITGDQASYEWAGSTIEAVLIELGVDYLGSQVFYWSVKPTSLTIETETSVRSFTVTRKNHPPKYGEWLFDQVTATAGDGFGTVKGLIGEDLRIRGTTTVSAFATAWYPVKTFGWEDGKNGPKAGLKALDLKGLSWLQVTHGMKPQGSDKYINCYTMLWDYYAVSLSSEKNTVTLCNPFLDNYWTRPELDLAALSAIPKNADRGASLNQCMSIENMGPTGTGNISGVQTIWSNTADTFPDDMGNTFVTGKWYRLVWRVDLTNQKMDFWVDGKGLAYDRSNPTVLVKDASRWALDPDGFYICATRNANILTDRIGRFVIWDYYISNDEVKALGVAGDPTDIGNE
jgi:hypothetical protein